MKSKKTKFLMNEVNLFYIKMNASQHTIEYISERRGEIKHSVCNPIFSKEELGWETKIDVIDYIRNTYL